MWPAGLRNSDCEDGRGSGDGDSTLNAVPQSPQNFERPGFSEPHLGQRMLSPRPHCAQNFLLAGFSKPQLKQRIDIL